MLGAQLCTFLGNTCNFYNSKNDLGSQKIVFNTIVLKKRPYLGWKYAWENITTMLTPKKKKDLKNGKWGKKAIWKENILKSLTTKESWELA